MSMEMDTSVVLEQKQIVWHINPPIFRHKNVFRCANFFVTYAYLNLTKMCIQKEK